MGGIYGSQLHGGKVHECLVQDRGHTGQFVCEVLTVAAASGEEEESLQGADKGLAGGLSISIVSLSCLASRTVGCAPWPVLSGEESNKSDRPRVLPVEVDCSVEQIRPSWWLLRAVGTYCAEVKQPPRSALHIQLYHVGTAEVDGMLVDCTDLATKSSNSSFARYSTCLTSQLCQLQSSCYAEQYLAHLKVVKAVMI